MLEQLGDTTANLRMKIRLLENNELKYNHVCKGRQIFVHIFMKYKQYHSVDNFRDELDVAWIKLKNNEIQRLFLDWDQCLENFCSPVTPGSRREQRLDTHSVPDTKMHDWPCPKHLGSIRAIP